MKKDEELKKEYNAPEMKVVKLEHQVNLLNESDVDPQLPINFND